MDAADRPDGAAPVIMCQDCASRQRWRTAAAVLFGCLGIGAAYVLGALAVILARNGGQLPQLPRVTVAITRPLPADPSELTVADAPGRDDG